MITKNSNFIIKTLFLFGIFFFFSVFSTLANYNQFVDNLELWWIDTFEISEKSELSRYELSRLMNAVECEDCINPSMNMINKYNSNYWQSFSSINWNYFGDIEYKQAFYSEKSYYYCVAYVGDNNYMNWYPGQISPICAGDFCGYRSVIYSEFYQVLTNLISKYIYPKYSVSWENIKKWNDWLEAWSYKDLYVNNVDDNIIDVNAKLGKEKIDSAYEFDVYIKYCMFNLNECGFKEFKWIPEWYWPIWQINILLKEWIISEDDFINLIFKKPTGKEILESIYNVSEIVACDPDFDFDCDNILNNNDNCPNHFNPTQTDTDKDGIGDVCDDDIDNDWIKNPIGIVDDTWAINIEKYDPNMDNCLYIKNEDQKDLDENGIGDICKAWPWVTIDIQWTNNIDDFSAKFVARIEWNYDRLEWDFGDGNKYNDLTQEYTFTKEWKHKILLKVFYWDSMVSASSEIFVWKKAEERNSLKINSNKMIGTVNADFVFQAKTDWKFDQYVWTIWKEQITNATDILNYNFTENGSYVVKVFGYNSSKVEAIASIVVRVGIDSIWVELVSDKSIVKKWENVYFKTNVSNIKNEDISNVVWSLWDSSMKETNSLSTYHSFDKWWVKSVKQTIYLKDWLEIDSFVSVFVEDEKEMSNYYITSDSEKLVYDMYDEISIGNKNSWNLWNTKFIYNFGEKILLWDDVSMTANIWGFYKNSVSSFVDSCDALQAHSTIAVASNDMCLSALLDGSLSSYTCDMDEDNIPDICDQDINNNWKINIQWIIKSEPEDCNYTCDNLNLDLIKKYYLDKDFVYKWNEKDNCWLETATELNVGGLDSDLWWGFWSLINDCLSKLDLDDLDTDWDGVSDLYDQCVNLPETYNWYLDNDWCPEIGYDDQCDKNLQIDNEFDVEILNCNSCPCQFVGLDWDINYFSNIKAQIMNIWKTKLYSESLIEDIQDFI